MAKVWWCGVFSRAALLVALPMVLLAGCGGSDPFVPPPDPVPVTAPVPAPTPAPVSAVIGAAGGTLKGPDGVELIVPAGALAADTTLTIARSSAGAPELPLELKAGLPVYEITPHDLDFAQPVQLRMPLGGAAEADAAVMVASPSEDWAATTPQIEGQTAVFERMRLSWYSSLQGYTLVCAPRSNDPYPCQLTGVSAGNVTATPASALQPNSTINGAATLNFNISYGAARDCRDARLRIYRSGPTAAPRVTLLDQAVSLTPSQTNSRRSIGTLPFQTTVDGSLNGTVNYFIGFGCTRAFDGRRVGGYTSGTYRINIPASTAPAIATQPANASVTEPAAATFTVAATGAATLAYQWQRNVSGTWTDLAGATSASYTTPATTRAADNGAQFRVTVSNGAGTVVSNPVTLTVLAAAASAPWQADSLIAGGGTQTLVVAANGELWSWGFNNAGALGRGGGPIPTTPDRVTTLGTNVRSVTAGAWYSIALLKDGTVWAWGDGDRVGEAVNSSGAIQLPLQVRALANVRAVSTRYWHTLALREDGTVWGFGPENFSALGPQLGNRAARQIPGLADVRQIAAGEQHSIALLADGTVRTWGSNSLGQLGVDTAGAARTAPQTVPITNVVAIAASSFASFALRSDGTLWRWGNFVRTTNIAPVQVPFTGSIKRLAAGNYTLHVLRSDDIPFGWGDNQFGRVGIGVVGGTVTELKEIGIVGAASDLAGGEFHTMAVRADGRVFTWGNNGAYQLRGVFGPDAAAPQDTGFTR
jgi:alpha-tubulin suppressor-like RCC1 family protein